MAKCKPPHDCFSCPYPDCIKNGMNTKAETEFAHDWLKRKKNGGGSVSVNERTYGINLHICTASKLLC